MNHYDVLKPIFTRDTYSQKENWHASWQKVGEANSMEQAKSLVRWPVLQRITSAAIGERV